LIPVPCPLTLYRARYEGGVGFNRASIITFSCLILPVASYLAQFIIAELLVESAFFIVEITAVQSYGLNRYDLSCGVNRGMLP